VCAGFALALHCRAAGHCGPAGMLPGPSRLPAFSRPALNCPCRPALCCCRNRVEPDNQLYGMLMRAAGASGDMSLVLVLAEEMRREGLTPCTVSLMHGQPASQPARPLAGAADGRPRCWAELSAPAKPKGISAPEPVTDCLLAPPAACCIAACRAQSLL
jgi:pentatricopeptide repeat protein